MAVAHHFRGVGKEGYAMLPISYPVNRALFAAFFENDLSNILSSGRLRVGKGVVTLKNWTPDLNSIPLEVVKGSRWVRIWGLPLFE